MRLIKSVQLNHKGVLSKRKGLYVIDGQKRLVTQENYVPEGRTLHLIDPENLMGGPWAGRQALRGAVLSYRRAAVVGEHDIATLGVNPGLYVVAVICAREVWSSAKVVFGAGPNGADMALLGRVKDHSFVISRYARIVIGSGDGIFAPMVKAFMSYGLRVEVVTLRRSLSRELGTAAACVRFIDAPEDLAA